MLSEYEKYEQLMPKMIECVRKCFQAAHDQRRFEEVSGPPVHP